MSILETEVHGDVTSEELLAEFATTQSASVFEELYNRHRDEVFSLTLKFLRDPNDAEDVTQEVFLRVHQHPDTYDPERPVRPWLLQAAANQAINYRERVKTRAETDDGLAEDVLDHRGVSPPENAIQQEVEIRVRELVAKLPEIERQIIHMLHYEELTYQEMAEKLGISVGDVKNRNRRAMGSLRWMLCQDVDSNLAEESVA